MKLTLPLPPNIANGRYHWAQKHRLKKKFYQRCDQMSLLVPRSEWPDEPHQKADVRVKLCTWGPMDRDNQFARCKWVLDWLVTRGVIQDDASRFIDLTVTNEVDRKDRRTEVEVWGR